MAPTPLKKVKKSAEKPTVKSKGSSVAAPLPLESSSKLLKRKNDEDDLEPAKKIKNSKFNSKGPAKASKPPADTGDGVTPPNKQKGDRKKTKEKKETSFNIKSAPSDPAPPLDLKVDNQKPKANVLKSISRPIIRPTAVSSKQKPSKIQKEFTPISDNFDEDDKEEKNSSEEDRDEESEEENEFLQGFSTDEDSSDEDQEPSNFDVGKLPTIAKDDETVKRKLENAKRQPTEDRGALFIGRLPHGFYEDQLKAYFSQFGNVTRLRVSRNKKTGKSKHYAFVEFDSSTVAKIVAETMDNYLIMGHILRCKVIPKEEVHPGLWVGANRKWRVVPRDRVVRVQHNKSRSEGEQKRATKRLLRRQAQRKRKLAEMGINYDIDVAGYRKTEV